MLAKWLEEYRRLSRKMWILSQFGAFVISIFTFLSLYDWLQIYLNHPNWIVEYRLMSNGLFDMALIFQIIISVIFGSRFILLFFKTKNIAKTNTLLYLVGIFLLSIYWFFSEPVRPRPELYSTYDEIFAYTSRGFDVFGYSYLILSPLRRIITIIVALIKSKGLNFNS